MILIHGNGCTRQRLYNMIQTVRSWGLKRPIVCNEDSQAIGQLQVAFQTGVSWGYYNNMTKQEPPTDWSITPGEDMRVTVPLYGTGSRVLAGHRIILQIASASWPVLWPAGPWSRAQLFPPSPGWASQCPWRACCFWWGRWPL